MSFVEEVKARADTLVIISERITLQRKGAIYSALCPFHTEKTPSFVVFPEKGTWHCFGCGIGGDVISFLEKYDHLTFMEAVKLLAERYNVEMPGNLRETAQNLRYYQVLEKAAALYADRLNKNVILWQYVNNRVTDQGRKDYQIGYAGHFDNSILETLLKTYAPEDLIGAGLAKKREDGSLYPFFNDRIMIPIRTASGRVCGFGARVLPGQEGPKFINSPQSPIFNKGNLLYGYDKAKPVARQNGTLILVEGYFDAVLCQMKGFTNTVAVMGTALTEAQMKGLRGKLIVALDSDQAGRAATLKAINVASTNQNLDVYCAILPEGLDPDECVTAGAWQTILDDAKPSLEYMLDGLVGNVTRETPAPARAEIATQFLALWTNANELTRGVIEQRLAERLLIGTEAMHNWFVKESKPQPKVEKPVATRLPQKATDEQRYIASILRKESCASAVNRMLRSLGLDAINAEDFDGEIRALYNVIEEGCTQLDESLVDYVLKHLPEACAIVYDNLLQMPELSEAQTIACAMRIRRARIQKQTRMSVQAEIEPEKSVYKGMAVIDAYLRGNVIHV